MGRQQAVHEEELVEDDQNLDESGDNFEPGEPVADETQPQDVQDVQVAREPDIDPEVLAELAGEDRPKMVPHSRFNEVNEEAKRSRQRVLELEEELARSKGSRPAEKEDQSAAPVAYDYDQAEERYASAILDGETSLARQIRAEIRARERADAIAEAERAADSRYNANRARDDEARAIQERDQAISQAYREFPFLNSDSDSANQEAIEEALALTNLYVSRGMRVGEALSLATSRVGPRYAVAQEVKGPFGKSPVIDVAQSLQRESRIPPQTSGLGARATKLDVSRMTATDIKKLSAEDEAALSGDVVD